MKGPTGGLLLDMCECVPQGWRRAKRAVVGVMLLASAKGRFRAQVGAAALALFRCTFDPLVLQANKAASLLLAAGLPARLPASLWRAKVNIKKIS